MEPPTLKATLTHFLKLLGGVGIPLFIRPVLICFPFKFNEHGVHCHARQLRLIFLKCCVSATEVLGDLVT